MTTLSVGRRCRLNVVASDRAKLERIFKSTRPTLTPEKIRMAIYRRLSRVHDVELGKDKDGAFEMIILRDSNVPEQSTSFFMRKLEHIADLINAWGVSDLVLHEIDELPLEFDEEEVRFRLGFHMFRPHGALGDDGGGGGGDGHAEEAS